MPLALKVPKTAVAVSVGIAVAAGAIDEMGYPFSISRVLVFLPFFITGTVYGKQILDLATNMPRIWKFSAAALCLGLGLILFSTDIDQGWLYGSYSFERLNSGTADGLAIRAGLLAIAALTTFAVLSLMPQHRNPATVIGRRSLGIFVLHGFVVLVATPLLPPEPVGANTLFALAVCVVTAIVIVKFLAAEPFDRSVRLYGSKVVRLTARPFQGEGRQTAGRQ